MTSDFSVGQRWISDTESDLGLGTIIDEELRQITVLFLATGDTRIYSKESAPLTRVAFAVGDSITSHAGWSLTVESVEEDDGTLVYFGHRDDTQEATALPESDLNNFLQFRSPRDRLFAGLIDGQRWYDLRRRVFENRHRLAHSPIRGLMGARVTLLPHQVYIAVEAGQRPHPRVLLADEVGLGKTIEAGLILHSQWVTQQVRRVLVIVPPALIHQWLVEMLRKFNLTFSIMDEDRFLEQTDTAPDGNPFLAEQLVLCSLDTLLDNEEIGDAAIAGEWDMLIADEAHHLTWQPGNPSPAYSLVNELSLVTPSVLLLTATPEQLGREGHFARLQLLDPDRFNSLERYLDEETSYQWVAEVAERLSSDTALEAGQIEQIATQPGLELTASERSTLSSSAALAVSDLGQSLIDRLIDRHGTGRLLFRNTRSAISGFPARQLHGHALPDNDPDTLLAWLIEYVGDSYPDKTLLICSHRETVQQLAESLRMAGVASAQFHEDLSIVERDRAAAWFADPDEDCRLLLCSEIGSEGRNFQFLHRLILLELPSSPDLLEQRIGRLDRIGQTHDIDIHVPYATGTREERLFRWYREGLNAFESICQVGYSVRNTLGDRLDAALDDPADTTLEALIAETSELSQSLQQQLDAGRDRLLEINSNRPDRIQEHDDALARAERDFRLHDFMSAVFDRFGVNVEEQANSWILHPSDHMQVEHFPHLSGSGMTITFDRATALQREDFTFLSWDHPMVTAAMDLILDEGYGQADCQVVSLPELPKGLAFVEGLFTLQCTAPPALNMERYLPINLQSFHVGIDGTDYTSSLEFVNIDSARQRYDRKMLRQVVQKHRASLETIIDKATALAEANVPALLLEARDALTQEHESERERLVALQSVNDSIRSDEIDGLDARFAARLSALEGTHVRPVGVRVLFNQ